MVFFLICVRVFHVITSVPFKLWKLKWLFTAIKWKQVMAEDLQESITIAACTCMRLSITELWNNSYQLEGVPVIVHGLDVPSRALTEVVSSETQQPSNTPPSRPSVANLILWWVIFSSGREISRWKRIHFCKNVPRLICLCEDYDVFSFLTSLSISVDRFHPDIRNMEEIFPLKCSGHYDTASYRFCLSCGNRQFLNNAELFLINTHCQNILMLW